MDINGTTAVERAMNNASPTFTFRKDGITCRRLYSIEWEYLSELVLKLRGNTIIDNDYFSRTPPHTFFFQGMSRPFACIDVSEAKGAGMPRNTAGLIDTEKTTSDLLVYDSDFVGVAAKAHIVADYMVPQYAIISDDDTDDPVNPDPATTLEYEWDRYTKWTVDCASQLINVPQGAYKYFNNKQPVNIPIRIPVSEAKISAKIFNLPLIPPACFIFNGAVNHDVFDFFLQPVDGFANNYFRCEKETLLYLYSKSEERMAPTGEILNDVTLYFSYRQYGHNTTPHYIPSTKKVEFERIAADVTTLQKAQATKSAPFRLRNFGYFWSPLTPPDQDATT